MRMTSAMAISSGRVLRPSARSGVQSQCTTAIMSDSRVVIVTRLASATAETSRRRITAPCPTLPSIR